jgi:hypothetical protein
LTIGSFGSFAEFGSPCAYNFIRKRAATITGIVAAVHARIQMDFCVPSEHRIMNEGMGFGHGLGRVFAAPDVRTKMIATQKDLLNREILRGRKFRDKLRELRRSATGVTTVLIYLIGSGFNDQKITGLPGMLHGRLENEGMRGADAVNTDGVALAILLEDA